MGWASERQIENHNELMESDAEYVEEYERYMLDMAMEIEMEESEAFNLFGYKMDYKGYTETYRENKNYV